VGGLEVASWSIRRISRPALDVFRAVQAAAPRVGYSILQADPAGGHLYLLGAAGTRQPGPAFDVAITDSGTGSTVVHISWDRGVCLPWPLPSVRRRAGRLWAAVCEHLAEGAPG
jgi:hypothetical protein